MKRFESFGLDTSNECLWRDGVQIALPPKPFAVLRYMVENPARLISHDELLDALWPETYVQPQVLRTYMLDLRKILGDDASQPRFIQTLPKRGYCFVAAVTESTATEYTRDNAHRITLSQLPDSAIVGREQELSRLISLMDSLTSGQRRVVFVTGEAGIGKTALVDAFCRQHNISSQASIARGQCIEGFGGKEQYYPVMEALSQLCASPDGDRACRVLSRMAPAWLAVRELDSGSSATSPTANERMPGDLCAALEELATEKPLMLIFEDLHWADDSTLHLISALARRRASAKLMMLVTCRPQDLAAEFSLKSIKQDLLMRRLCDELALTSLPKAAVGALLSRELKQDELPQSLASFVHRHSEGNPLFVIAIMEHLISQKFLVRDGSDISARWVQHAPYQEMEAGVPDGLAKMIELEIERLSHDEQRMLEAGSLISVAFPAWAVAAALGTDPAETEESCDGLARRIYFLRRAGQDELPDGTCSAFYVFAHGLYREVLYQRQSASRRAQRHIRIAQKLRELFAGSEASVAREVAMHYESAGNWHNALNALRDAASHAQQRQAYAEAVQLLEHSLRITENLVGAERAAAAIEIRSELTAAHEAASQSEGI